MTSGVDRNRSSATIAVSVAVIAALAGLGLLAWPSIVREAPVSFRGAHAQEKYVIEQPVVLAADPRLVIERGTLSIPKANAGETLRAVLTGRRPRIILEDATLVVGLAPSAGLSEPHDAGGAANPLIGALAERGFETLRLERGTIVVMGKDHALERLSAVEADISIGREGYINGKGTFAVRGEPLSFEASFETGDAHSHGDLRAAKLQVSGSFFRLAIDGGLSARDAAPVLAGKATLAVANLREAARWLGAPLPEGRGFQDFRASGDLEWSERAMAFQDATFEMDGNRASGNLTLNIEGGKPAIDGTLAFERLDLPPYLAAGPGEPSREDGVASKPASPLSIFEFFDADVRVSAEAISGPGVALGAAAATISLENGRLLADIAELGLGSGANGGGQLTLDVKGAEPAFALRGRIDALDAGKAARDIFGYSAIEGRVDATLDLTAGGSSADRILSTLGGTFAVEAPDGGRIGVSAAALASLSRGEIAAGWNGAERGHTPIDWLLGRFTVKGGRVTAQALKAGADARQFSVTGTVDLPARQLDLHVSIAPRLGGSGPAVAPETAIEIEGPWSRPRVKAIDPAKAARPKGQASPRLETVGAATGRR